MLTNLLRGVTWLAAPSKGPARLITWSEISALIEHCLTRLELVDDTCQSPVTEECWLLSVLYQHLDVTAVTLNADMSFAALHRRVIRCVVQHMTRVTDQGQHLPLVRGKCSRCPNIVITRYSAQCVARGLARVIVA